MSPQASSIQEFATWHSARVLRKTGKRPAQGTLKTKASRLRVCLALSGADGLRDFATTLSDREAVESLLDVLATKMSSGSQAVAVHTLFDFAEYAKTMKWIPSHALLPGDVPPANPQKSIVIYTPEESELLLTCARARGLRWWMFLLTIAHTGRRVGEILDLQFAWLNLTADTPNFHLPTTKNGRQAYVPLGPSLTGQVWTAENIAALKAEDRTGPHRAFSRDIGTYPFPWTYTTAHRALRVYCEALGVENRGFHCFRHTKATNMLAKGVPIQAVSSLLGHASVATTDRIYNHSTALSYSQYVD